MRDYDQELMDLEQQLTELEERRVNNIDDLKFFYNTLLTDYLVLIKEHGYGDVAKIRSIWEEKIKFIN